MKSCRGKIVCPGTEAALKILCEGTETSNKNCLFRYRSKKNGKADIQKVAEKRLFIQGLKPVRKFIYAIV